jgi:hypothetical protein
VIQCALICAESIMRSLCFRSMRFNAKRRAAFSRAGVFFLMASALGTFASSSAIAQSAAVDAARHIDLECQLSIPAKLTRHQSAILTISLHNRSEFAVAMLKRNTPMEGWLADSLVVEHDGKAQPYIGAMAKRMPPDASEYLRLKPGMSKRFRVALQRAYDVSAPRRYRVSWSGALMDAQVVRTPRQKIDLATLAPTSVACAPIAFERR